MLVTYFGKAANQKLAALVKNNSTKGVLLRTFWNYIAATSATSDAVSNRPGQVVIGHGWTCKTSEALTIFGYFAFLDKFW